MTASALTDPWQVFVGKRHTRGLSFEQLENSWRRRGKKSCSLYLRIKSKKSYDIIISVTELGSFTLDWNSHFTDYDVISQRSQM